MRTITMLCGLLLAASFAACKEDSKEAAMTAGAAPALDVTVTPSGGVQVSLSDEKGQPVSTKGVTGHIELPNGSNVTLTPDSEGLSLRGPLGEMMATPDHDCVAKMHVTMPGGAKRTQSVDLCRAGVMNGHEDHAGQGHTADGASKGAAKSVDPVAVKDLGADMNGMGAMSHGTMAGSGDAPMGPDAMAMGTRMKAMGAKMKDKATTMKGMADSKSGKSSPMEPDDMMEMGMAMMEMGDMMEMGMGAPKDPSAAPQPDPMPAAKAAPMPAPKAAPMPAPSAAPMGGHM